MQAISRHAQSQYKIGPGTLYDNLQKDDEPGIDWWRNHIAPPPMKTPGAVIAV
jgi:hypothetical protein